MPLVMESHSHSHFDPLPDTDSDHLHDASPLELSDGGSGPQTPPALLTAAHLPSDPNSKPLWPYPPAGHQSLLKKKSAKNNHNNPHMHTPTPPTPAPPTISTFSASNLNHIHIVQPYVHAGAQSASSNDASKSSNPPNQCTTSTFSVHPAPAPTLAPGPAPAPAPPATSTPTATGGQHSFANPFCTNALHPMMPTMGPAPSTASGQPPRPANAWILYRSDKMKDIPPALPGQARRPQADISKLIAAMWKAESPEVRQRYEAMSDLKKAEHLAMYPGYRFQPMKKAEKEKMRAEKKAEKEREKVAQMALKAYRKPKPRRGMTEESTLSDVVASPVVGNGAWQDPAAPTPILPPVAATQTPISPLAARGHTFSYQPYAVPSPTSSSTPGPPAKRKRIKPKVETQTSSILSEEPKAEYAPSQGIQHYDPQTNHSFTPQPPSSSSDPKPRPNPPYPNQGSQQQADECHTNGNTSSVSATIQPVVGEANVFAFDGLDPSRLPSEIQLDLPQDLDWTTLPGLGGLDEFNLGGGFEGLGDLSQFVNMEGPGLLDGVMDMGMGTGMNDYSQGMVDPNALSYPTPTTAQAGLPYPDTTFSMTSSTSSAIAGVTPSHPHPADFAHGHHGGHAPHLSISTQSLQSAVTSPVVETPHSATAQFFLPHSSYTHTQPEQFHQHQHYHQHSQSSQFMSPQCFQLVSPTHSHFASPPPPSVIEDGPNGGTPMSEYVSSGRAALADRDGRKVAGTWQ